MSQSEELVSWSYEQKCMKVVESLAKNGFTAIFCPTAAAAREYILAEAVEAGTIGFGGSLSVAELGVIEPLRETGRELLIHGAPGLSLEERLAVMRRQLVCDLFLTGTNALTRDGMLVNIDGTGNRVAGISFSPGKLVVVASLDKICPNLESALRRARDAASPPNAARLGIDVPCVATGHCVDCNSPHRICRVVSILERAPLGREAHVVLVDSPFGY